MLYCSTLCFAGTHPIRPTCVLHRSFHGNTIDRAKSPTPQRTQPNVLHLVIISLPSKHLKTSQNHPQTFPTRSLGLQLHELKQKHVLSTFSPRNKTVLWRSRTTVRISCINFRRTRGNHNCNLPNSQIFQVFNDLQRNTFPGGEMNKIRI